MALNLGKLGAMVNHALFEEEKQSTQEVATPVLPKLTSSRFAQAYVSPNGVDTAVALEAGSIDPSLYNSLKDKTDFDKTDIGSKFKEILTPLANLPLTESQKISTALQLGASRGITSTSLRDTYQGCLNTLEGQKTKFDQAMTTASSKAENLNKDISDIADQIAGLEKQIEDARKRQTDVTTEMIQSKAKIEQNKATFQTAYDRRKQELTKELDHYSNLS